jgi:hypothetical protein
MPRTTTFPNAIAGLSGNITVRFDLFGGSNGSNGTFRMDDFVLNGFTTAMEEWRPMGYRYGFGSHEKDDEVKGSGNLLAFGGMGYDSRIVLRWQPDPVFKAWESPYAVFRGNPIYFADPDGRDGIVTIKLAEPITKGKKVLQGGTLKNPHQMTIKANYYYNKEAINGLGGQQALDDAISAYNNSNFTVKGADGQYYKVKFEINAIPVNDSDPQEILRNHTRKDNAGDGRTMETHFPFGNVIAPDIPGMSDGIDKDELGSASHNQISLRSQGINDAVEGGASREITLYNVLIHEIGHNLGGAHEDGGIMNRSTTQTNNTGISINGSNSTYKNTIKNKLTLGNVEKIIGTLWKGGRSQERPGQVKKVEHE